MGNLVSDESLLSLKCSKSFVFKMLPVDRFPTFLLRLDSQLGLEAGACVEDGSIAVYFGML